MQEQVSDVSQKLSGMQKQVSYISRKLDNTQELNREQVKMICSALDQIKCLFMKEDLEIKDQDVLKG